MGLKFMRAFPERAATFFDALEQYKIEEARHALEEAERLQQEQLKPDNTESENIDAICDKQHECCGRIATEIHRHKNRIAELEGTIKEQNLKFEQLQRYIENEFGKLKPDEEKIRATRNCDEWIDGKWHLPTETLYKAAVDTDRSACLNFMDTIFGQQEFRKHRSFTTMPEQLQKAAELALCKLLM